MSEEFHLESNASEDRGKQRRPSVSVPKRQGQRKITQSDKSPDLFDVAEKTIPETSPEPSWKGTRNENYFESDEYKDQPGDDNPYARSRR